MNRETQPDLDSRRGAPVVLYIAGSGRSGSTLLERMLGQIPGTVNLGELLDLPRRAAPRDERCGCGEAFSACPFWTAVGETLPGGWADGDMRSLQELQVRVARQRHLVKLLLRPLAGRFGQDLRQYAARISSIYAAVSKVSDADYVVDSSKWPALALALYRGGVDVRVIHLVRDVRGVANSLAHRSVLRPHARETHETMYRNRVASAAGRWLVTQTEVDLLALRGLPITRVRYEDLVVDPGTVVAGALTELGVALPHDGLSHIDGSIVTLLADHGLSGNPSRFNQGATSLRLDLRWREELTRAERVIVELIGLPWALRHRRVGRPDNVDRGQDRAVTFRADLAQLRPGPHLKTDGPRSQGRIAPSSVSWPLVTAVVATHGRPDLRRQAIESAVAQDYPGDLEIIVVHDQEPVDRSLCQLGAPGRSISVTENLRRPGLAGARNTGVDLARGAFIATLDDDDLWHPQKVRRQVQRFQADPFPVMLGTGLRLLLPGGKTAEWRGRAPSVPYRTLLRNRVKELHSSTLMMRRDVFAKAGLYDETLPYGYAEDYDWVLRVGRVGPIGLLLEPLADIRKDNQSYYRGRAARTAPALREFLDKHQEIQTDRRGHARILGQIAFALASTGDRREALRVGGQAWARWPLSPYPYVALAHAVSGADPAKFAALARRFGRGMA